MMEEESECGRVIWVCWECCFYLVRLDDGQRREVHACLTVKISAPDQDTIRGSRCNFISEASTWLFVRDVFLYEMIR